MLEADIGSCIRAQAKQ